MIVHYFDLKRVATTPKKANPPLIVNADTPLPFASARKFFQSICRRNSKIGDIRCAVQHAQLPQRDLLNIRRQFARAAQFKNAFCFSAFERSDHLAQIYSA
jgi:hypothetical protein